MHQSAGQQHAALHAVAVAEAPGVGGLAVEVKGLAHAAELRLARRSGEARQRQAMDGEELREGSHGELIFKPMTLPLNGPCPT